MDALQEYITKVVDRAAATLKELDETPASRITPDMIGRAQASMMLMIDLLRITNKLPRE